MPAVTPGVFAEGALLIEGGLRGMGGRVGVVIPATPGSTPEGGGVASIGKVAEGAWPAV